MRATAVRPILKWAGGKSQLLPKICSAYPKGLADGTINTYVEPFVGGGAVFLDVAQRYDVKRWVLADINPELVLLYRAVRDDVPVVIKHLRALEARYLSNDSDGRLRCYLDVRSSFNCSIPDWDALLRNGALKTESASLRAAHTIFLNRTCFNGLFRVNRKGEFNVPHGRYRNPKILDESNLRAFSMVLQHAEIAWEDFSIVSQFASSNAFIYYDPPYRPLSQTSSFTSYSKYEFGDPEQARLAAIFKQCHELGAWQMLSNSDPWSCSKDPFFEELYRGFNIHRVLAKRAINSVGSGRGAVGEIVVTNYATDNTSHS